MAIRNDAQLDLFVEAASRKKVCTRCREARPLDNYGKCKGGRNGLHPNCRSCLTERTRDWRARDPTKAKEDRRRHYLQNKERVLSLSALYRAAHKLEEHAARIAHYQRNKESVAAQTKAYREAHPDIYAAAFAKRRASKRQATPYWADFDKIAEFSLEAARLTRETGIPHEVDHIVPLQSKWVCGLHYHHNLAVIPATANRSKANRTWPNMGALAP